MNQPVDEVFGLFPVPFMRAPSTLGPPLVEALIDAFEGRALNGKNSSANLSRTGC